jgi:hypothetical protein
LADRIALIGRARSGKDSVAGRLVEYHDYTRVAFADRLKEAVLALDPLIFNTVHLAEMVELNGWEAAKSHAEVRRILQHYGQAIRDIDPDFWIRAAFPAMLGRVRIVVSDVRYRNEAEALRSAGFTLVRISRPGLPLGVGSDHVSETELADYAADLTITNGAGLRDLYAQADRLAT